MADIINNGVPTAIQIYGRAPNGQLQAVTTDGSGNISIVGSQSGTVSSGTAGQLGYYATSSTTMSGNPNATISNGALTLGVATSVAGSLAMAGATSGTATLTPPAVAGTVSNPLVSSNAISAPAYATATNAVSTATPAVCGSAAAGIVQIAAVVGATTLVVQTTAVTANSRIFLTYSTVGITAPANIATTITQPYVSAISAGTSFTISIGVGPVTNPINVFYMIVN